MRWVEHHGMRVYLFIWCKKYVRRMTETPALLQHSLILQYASDSRADMRSNHCDLLADYHRRPGIYAATLTSFKATVWPFFQGVFPLL